MDREALAAQWVALCDLEAWIDHYWPLPARLHAGWHDLGAEISAAIRAGDLSARGRAGTSLRRITAEAGAATTANALRGELTVTTRRPAQGLPLPQTEITRWREVEIEAGPLRAWCTSFLGTPSSPPPAPLGNEAQAQWHTSTRAKPKLQLCMTALCELFPDGPPGGMSRGVICKRALDKAAGKTAEISAKTMQRAFARWASR
jgi:hypothetical protein